VQTKCVSLISVLGGLLQGPLYFWSYVYYLSKYYEFLDTVLLTLKVWGARKSKLSSVSNFHVVTGNREQATRISSGANIFICRVRRSRCHFCTCFTMRLWW
jgi:GNS1/SUR4 family